MRKKVLNVTPQGDFDSQFGHFYKWEIEFEDMKAEYLSKTETQTKFVKGQEIDVELSTREYNGRTINKVKPASNFQGQQRQSNQSSRRDELIVKQNALSNACNVIGEADVAKILEVAELFSNWVLKGEKPTSTTKNDLPF